MIERRNFMKQNIINIKKIPKLIIVVLLFFFASLLQFIPIHLFNMDIYNITVEQQLWLTIFSDSVLLIVLVAIYFKSLKEDFQKMKNNFYSLIDNGIKYWLIGLIAMVISNIIIGSFVPQAQATNEQGVQLIIHGTGVLSIIAIGILAPIIEELTFRKAFREVFQHKILFAFASGLIFGSLHVLLSLNSGWDLLYIIPYSSLGVAFGYMYQKTDNIYTPIIMHIFHNTALTTLSLISGAMILL